MKLLFGIALASLLVLAATQTQAESARFFSPVPDSLVQQTKAKKGGPSCSDLCARRCSSSGRGNCMSICMARCK